MSLNLYMVRTDDYGYNCYDAFVVVSESAEKAKCYLPKSVYIGKPDQVLDTIDWDRIKERTKADKAIGYYHNSWTSDRSSISVELIGIAADGMSEGQQIISSFNAG